MLAMAPQGHALACSGAQSSTALAAGGNRTFTGLVFTNDNDASISIDRLVVYAVSGAKLCDIANPMTLGPRQIWVWTTPPQSCIPVAANNIVGALRFVVWWSYVTPITPPAAHPLNPLDGYASVIADDPSTFIVRGRSTQSCKPIWD
ncbi:MAG TPA: hypothetical protein VMT17_03055 [Anaeromyxobacteraceae bacterium]|nr:hypothetical protein [Anaeromyxobacteraceae bacterium]